MTRCCAWKAGAQTVALRKQLDAMPDGGVRPVDPAGTRTAARPALMSAPARWHYFSKVKPKSKVLILDANEDVTSKGALFKKAW